MKAGNIKAIKNYFLFFVAGLFLLTSCNPAEEISEQMPVVSTGTISNVTTSTATCDGSIAYKGNEPIIARGVCWSTNSVPTVKNDTSWNGTGVGSFTGSIINLSAGTTYYVRAYAKTASGNWYGDVLQITTQKDTSLPDPVLNPNLTYGTMTDIDGNVYHTIKIGTQTWMAENLIVTKYRNGESIPSVTNNADWNVLSGGAQCTYNNNLETNSIHKFGRLYNFYAVTDSRNIAPDGWHVATDAEWSTLLNYSSNNLGSSSSVTKALAAATDWPESTVADAVGYIDQNTYTLLNNSSGFGAMPAGIRGEYGVFNYVANYGGWWTSTANDNATALFRSMSFYSTTTGKNVYNKKYALSVRCVKN